MRYYSLLLIAGTLFYSCTNDNKESSEKEGVETVAPASQNEVEVKILKKKAFDHELVSNGKVQAQTFSDLYFRTTSEPIAKIYVKNGEQVTKGQKVAELNLFTLQNKMAQAENSLNQAELEMQDVLIGQGYSADSKKDIPEEVLKLAKIKSGYEQALAGYELAKFNIEQAVMTAPFDGIVANLFDKQYNIPDASKPFCRIIGLGGMEVSFKVLESEIPLIKKGDKVEITPYSTGNSYMGNIAAINPLVDENGMVSMTATVNGNSKLFDGMNVRVSVKRSVPDQLIIPKTAVVLRSGKQVVFTLKDNKAMWNYVKTGLENMTEYTVTGDGLEDGMQVIVSGNVNLAHESPVKVVNSDSEK